MDKQITPLKDLNRGELSPPFNTMDDGELETARAAYFADQKRQKRERRLETRQKWANRLVGALAISAALGAIVGVVHNRNSNEESTQSDQPPVQEIQENVEAQTQEHEIHKALQEGRDPVIKVPADIAKGQE